jgi:hypothetical protein
LLAKAPAFGRRGLRRCRRFGPAVRHDD